MQTTAHGLIAGGPQLSVGLLTADLLHLGDELTVLEDAGIRLAHVDVMDGVFCPMGTFGPALIQALPERFIKDVHLMVDEPLDKVDAYVEAGADILTFHVEATRHPHRVLQSLAGAGPVRGVALNPGTPLCTLEPLLDDLELIQILAVNPGWSGQTFQPSTPRRLAQARRLIGDREIVLAVDGGVTRENIAHVASLDVDLIVAGRGIYDGADAAANVAHMVETMREAVVAGGVRAIRGAL